MMRAEGTGKIRPMRLWRAGALVAVLAVCTILLVGVTGCGGDKPVGPLARADFASDEGELPGPHAVPNAGVVEPPASGAFIGVFRPPAPFTIAALDSYMAVSDKPPAILMWFQPWTQGGSNQFDTGAVVATLRRGAIPMITWEPWDPGIDPNVLKNPAEQPQYRLQRVVDGQFDPYIRSWARGCAKVGGPIMLRPMHEMNGGWYPWGGTANGNSPETFKKAWIHVHDIFVEEGATNVTWVWSVNASSWPQTEQNKPSSYYPGDEYVDWTAISGFNWGDSRPTERWMTFDEIYREIIPYLESVGKPIVISEFASVETPGSKAEWISDAYEAIRTEHPSIKAIVFYDKLEAGEKGEQAWGIESSAASAKAYREAVEDPYFIPGPAPTLMDWATQLDSADWTYLLSFRRIY